MSLRRVESLFFKYGLRFNSVCFGELCILWNFPARGSEKRVDIIKRLWNKWVTDMLHRPCFFCVCGGGGRGARDVDWLIDLSRLTPASQAVPTVTAWEWPAGPEQGSYPLHTSFRCACVCCLACNVIALFHSWTWDRGMQRQTAMAEKLEQATHSQRFPNQNEGEKISGQHNHKQKPVGKVPYTPPPPPPNHHYPHLQPSTPTIPFIFLVEFP